VAREKTTQEWKATDRLQATALHYPHEIDVVVIKYLGNIIRLTGMHRSNYMTSLENLFRLARADIIENFYTRSIVGGGHREVTSK